MAEFRPFTMFRHLPLITLIIRMKLNILDIFVEVLVLLDVIKIKYVFVLCLVFPSSLLNSKQAYDPPAGYDIPYFRPTIDETVRGQGLSSPQEV